ncbi:MAG TPA: hypothetical protein VME18_04060 [Acidobacteriaceae bacterium]|nr:hypothetical protein [Acidobacteriaceae bacterium]
MRLLRLFGFLVLFGGIATGQTSIRRQGSAFAQGHNNVARVLPYATIRVCTAGSTGTPCNSPAMIYSDSAGAHPIPQATVPLTADNNGNYQYYALSGQYVEQISYPGTTTYSLNVAVGDPGTAAVAQAAHNATSVPQTARAAALPLAGGTMTGPLATTGLTSPSLNTSGAFSFAAGRAARWTASSHMFNGPVMAGLLNNMARAYGSAASGDMCAKINAAAASLGSNGGTVDARGFTGTQSCSSNPFSGITTPILLLLGDVRIQSSAAWTIPASNDRIVGEGPARTQLYYTGTASVSAVLTIANPDASVANPSTYLWDTAVSGMWISGNRAYVTDVVLLKATHHSALTDLSLWGASGCGVHTEFSVIDTQQDIRVSINDATYIGSASGGSPANGLCYDELAAGYGTTASAVIDPTIEGVSNCGIDFLYTEGMNITAGTSEENLHGVCNNNGTRNARDTVDGLDMEANTGADIVEAGIQDVYLNVVGTAVGGNSTFSGGYTQIIGGQLYGITINSSAVGTRLDGTEINCSAYTDNGIATNPHNLVCETGYVPWSGEPWTYRDTIPSYLATPYVPVALDPQDALRGQWSFTNAAETAFSNTTYSTGKPWQAILAGQWVNNYCGGRGTTPGAIVEVSSVNPTLAVCTMTLTFSVSSGGQFQAETTTGSAGYYGISFTGSVWVESLNSNAAPGIGLDIADSLMVGGKGTFTTTSARAGVSVGCHAGNPSTLVNGDIWCNSSTNTLNAQVNGATATLSAALSIPNNTPTCAAGTNVASCTLASGATNTRGEATIVTGSGYTTGTLATLSFSAALSAAPFCSVQPNGGATYYGLGHGTPSTASFTITNAVAATSATISVDYQCMP